MQPVVNWQTELGKALAGLRQHLWQLVGFSLVINLLYLLPSLYMLQVYDRVISSGSLPTLAMLTLMIIGGYAVLATLDWVRSSILVRINNTLEQRLAGRVFDASFRHALLGGNNPSQAVQDLHAVRNFLGSGAVATLLDVPWMPIYLVVAFLFNVWMGIMVLAGAAILFGLAWWNEQTARAPLAEANKTAIQANHYLSSSLLNAEVVAAMGMLPAIQQRWRKLQNNSLQQQTIASDRSANITAITKFTRILLQSLMLGLGALLVLTGDITAGMMIAGSIIMGRALAPVEGVIGLWKQLVNASLAMQRLDRLLHQFPALPVGMPLPPPTGALLVENITMLPPGASKPTLRGVAFSLRAGEVLGIIGPSASGKSTLARALVGVWPLHAGTVRLDGADIHQWDKQQLGPYVGYLPQDVELFQGSIAENIARMTASPDTGQVLAAASLAGVHDMVLRMPQGYDTVLGAGGMTLSGGQRQRIALARALYGMPSLIVLDEPNANLDEAGDTALLATIQKLKAENRTTVLITHKPGLLQAVDKLLVLQDGQLQIFGPRDGVIARLNELRQANTPPAQGALPQGTPAT